MLCVLVVTDKPQTGTLPAAGPSVEILHAHGAEDALEKLGRNRRIDAVLLAAGSGNAEIERAIREDNPAPPPLFQSEEDGLSLARVIARVVSILEGRGEPEPQD